MARAQAAQTAAYAKTVHGAVGKFLDVRWAGDLDDYRRLAPYAVLFLEWEAQFPEQWRSAGPGSPWGGKKRLLRQFADMGVPQPQIDAVTRLTLAAINRDQRCEDLGYVLVARSLDSPALRAGIDAAACSRDSTVRMRATYVRWAMDHVGAPVTPASWRAWCAGGVWPRPVPGVGWSAATASGREETRQLREDAIKAAGGRDQGDFRPPRDVRQAVKSRNSPATSTTAPSPA